MDWPYAQLYGRKRVDDFLRDALQRRGVPPRAAPILVLAGPRGSGGTALLAQLWEQYGKEAPGVRLDAAYAGSASDLLAGAMQGLGAKVPSIRAVHFPLLRLALKALAFVDDGGGRTSFDAYMRADPPAAFFRSFVADMEARLGPVLGSREQHLVAAAVESLAPLVLAALRSRGDAQRLAWFTRHVAGSRDGLGALWCLYEWQVDAGPEGDRALGRVLCEAFLDDLRTDYNAGHERFQRTRNCFLLLDNAQQPLATMFLELLEECRWDAARPTQSGEPEKLPDPLVVVAAHVGRPPHGGAPVDVTDERLRFTPDLVPDDGGWWLPVRLTDLSTADVRAMCRSQVLRTRRCDAAFVHEVVAGHPAATAVLTTALTRDGLTSDDLGRILQHDRSAPWNGSSDLRDGRPPTVVTRLLTDYVKPDVGLIYAAATVDGALDRLAVCAATPGMRSAACAAAFRYLGWDGAEAGRAREWFIENLWADDGGENGAPPTLHPVLSLLLQRWLASDAEQWTNAHSGYMAAYNAPADAALRHHHLLAQADVGSDRQTEAVAAFLHAQFDARPLTEWCAALDIVTSAPNRVRTSRSPGEAVTLLAGVADPADRARTIRRLAVACWLYRDRTFDPFHRLAKIIADEYENLAVRAPTGGDALFDRAADHRRIQKWWEGRP